MTVLGLDLSLTSSGIAGSDFTEAIKPKKLTRYARLRFIMTGILEIVECFGPDRVVVEGPSYNSQGGHDHERGGLWWMATDMLQEIGIGIAVAPPTNIKKFATGFGGGPKAGKDFVLLAAARHFEWFSGGNDEADALWACAMGYHHEEAPLLKRSAKQLEALEKCDWTWALPQPEIRGSLLD